MIDFRKELFGESIRDAEYDAFYEKWMDYRRQTNHLPTSANQECLKIHRKLFEGIPKNEKYQRAKIDTARRFDGGSSK